MFDIGFWEIAIIALIGLLILGPERLPRAARSIGLWVGKARRMLAEVKRDIDRELDASDLKKIKDEVKLTVEESKDVFEEASLKKDLEDAKSALEETAETLKEKVTDEPEAAAKSSESEKVADSSKRAAGTEKSDPAVQATKASSTSSAAETPKPKKPKKLKPVVAEESTAEQTNTAA